jgi:hypothetical protein
MGLFSSTILDDLGSRRQTDKTSRSSAGHDYLRKYEFFFRPFQDIPFTFLELGVFKGASLAAFREYFTRAEIIGVDCELESLRHAPAGTKVILGDLSQTEFLQGLGRYRPAVVMDDASHNWPDQLRALLVLFPVLQPGGLYVMEDIHTSFPPLGEIFSGGLEINPFGVLAKIAEYLTGDQRPQPIPIDGLRGRTLEPIAEHPQFHAEIRAIADQCDAVVFIKRSCLLIKKEDGREDGFPLSRE